MTPEKMDAQQTGQQINFEALAEEQSRLAEIGRIVSSTLNLDEALSAFVEPTRSLVPFDRIGINVVNEDMTEFKDVFVDDARPDAPSGGDHLPYRASALASDALANQVEFVANGRDYETYLNQVQPEQKRKIIDFKSFLLVPLIWQGSAIGSLNLRSTQVDAYSTSEISLAKQVAAQIAGVIASFSQREIIEKELEARKKLSDEQVRIAEIGRIVSSTLDIEEVFTVFAEHARHLVPWDRVIVAAMSDDRSHLISKYVAGIDLTGPTPLLGALERDEVYDRIINEKKPFLDLNQILRDDLPSGFRRAEALKVGLRSALITPLVWKGEVAGVLTFRSTDPTAYDDHHADLALQISRQIAGHIATADQYAIVERESRNRRRLAEEQRRIAEIGRIVSSTLEISEVFDSFAEQVRSLVSFDRIVVASVSEDRTELIDQFVAGLKMEDSGAGKRILLEQNDVYQRVFIEKKPFLGVQQTMRDYLAQTPIEQPRFDAGLRSMLVTPLLWKGKVEGVLTFRSTDSDAFGEHEVDLALQISQQIAGHIATADQYAIVERESQERQRLAEEQSRIAEIGRIVSSTLDVQEVLEAFVEQARALVPIDRMVVTSVDDEMTVVTDVMAVGLGVDPSTVGVSWPFDHNQVQAEVISTQTLFVRNGEEYKNHALSDPIERGRYDQGLRSILLVPLVWQGRCFGTINLRSTDANAYGDHEVELAEQIGAQIAGAFATANQYRLLEIAAADTQTQAAALNAAGDSVVILNPDTSIEWVNEAFVRSSGYSKEEAIGQTSPFMRSDKNPPEVFDKLWEQVLGGENWNARMWVRPKTGADYQVETSLTPVFDEAGNITRIVGIRRDITEVVQAEKDREATRDLDAQNQQLLQLNDQREEFFSTVSHELRTPLTSVMAFADILSRNRDGKLSNLQLEHIDVIKRNGRNLSALVEDMLDFSQLSTDRLKLNKTEFEIHSLLDSVVESLEPTNRQREQSLVITPHSTPIWITADRGRINQVISNLITNSCKYSPTSTRITLGVEARDQQLVITVTDQGYGIPESDLEQIFSPFFRSNQAPIREETGTGLGLAISKTLIDLHDGSIEASSKLGEGTEMTVTLPGATATPTAVTES